LKSALPFVRLKDSTLDIDSNHPQNDVLSLDGAHIAEPSHRRTNQLPPIRICFMIFLGFSSMAGADWFADLPAI
jgi:hypothetical protein